MNRSFIHGIQAKCIPCTKSQMVLMFAATSIFMPFIITCLMLLVTVIYAVVNKQSRQLMFADKKNRPIYLFSICSLVVPLFYSRYISVLAGVGLVITLLFYLFVKSQMDKRLYHLIIDTCCGASTICFVYAVIQKIVMGAGFRTTGGLLNANYYGTICELVIILAVYRVLTNPTYKWFYYSMIVVNISGIFLCDCQSAWLATIVGVVGLLAFSGYKKPCLIFIVASIVLVIVGLYLPGVLPRMAVMPQTFTTRMDIWSTAIEGIKAHWLFGQGTLTYLFSYMLYGGYKTYHAHSLYLDPFLSYGVVGVGLMWWYGGSIIARLNREHKQGIEQQHVPVIIGASMAIAVHGITDITILWVQTGMLLLIVISGAYVNQKNKA